MANVQAYNDYIRGVVGQVPAVNGGNLDMLARRRVMEYTDVLQHGERAVEGLASVLRDRGVYMDETAVQELQDFRRNNDALRIALEDGAVLHTQLADAEFNPPAGVNRASLPAWRWTRTSDYTRSLTDVASATLDSIARVTASYTRLLLDDAFTTANARGDPMRIIDSLYYAAAYEVLPGDNIDRVAAQAIAAYAYAAQNVQATHGDMDAAGIAELQHRIMEAFTYVQGLRSASREARTANTARGAIAATPEPIVIVVDDDDDASMQTTTTTTTRATATVPQTPVAPTSDDDIAQALRRLRGTDLTRNQVRAITGIALDAAQRTTLLGALADLEDNYAREAADAVKRQVRIVQNAYVNMRTMEDTRQRNAATRESTVTTARDAYATAVATLQRQLSNLSRRRDVASSVQNDPTMAVVQTNVDAQVRLDGAGVLAQLMGRGEAWNNDMRLTVQETSRELTARLMAYNAVIKEANDVAQTDDASAIRRVGLAVKAATEVSRRLAVLTQMSNSYVYTTATINALRIEDEIRLAHLDPSLPADRMPMLRDQHQQWMAVRSSILQSGADPMTQPGTDQRSSELLRRYAAVRTQYYNTLRTMQAQLNRETTVDVMNATRVYDNIEQAEQANIGLDVPVLQRLLEASPDDAGRQYAATLASYVVTGDDPAIDLRGNLVRLQTLTNDAMQLQRAMMHDVQTASNDNETADQFIQRTAAFSLLVNRLRDELRLSDIAEDQFRDDIPRTVIQSMGLTGREATDAAASMALMFTATEAQRLIGKAPNIQTYLAGGRPGTMHLATAHIIPYVYAESRAANEMLYATAVERQMSRARQHSEHTDTQRFLQEALTAARARRASNTSLRYIMENIVEAYYQEMQAYPPSSNSMEMQHSAWTVLTRLGIELAVAAPSASIYAGEEYKHDTMDTVLVQLAPKGDDTDNYSRSLVQLAAAVDIALRDPIHSVEAMHRLKSVVTPNVVYDTVDRVLGYQSVAEINADVTKAAGVALFGRLRAMYARDTALWGKILEKQEMGTRGAANEYATEAAPYETMLLAVYQASVHSLYALQNHETGGYLEENQRNRNRILRDLLRYRAEDPNHEVLRSLAEAAGATITTELLQEIVADFRTMGYTRTRNDPRPEPFTAIASLVQAAHQAEQLDDVLALSVNRRRNRTRTTAKAV